MVFEAVDWSMYPAIKAPDADPGVINSDFVSL